MHEYTVTRPRLGRLVLAFAAMVALLSAYVVSSGPARAGGAEAPSAGQPALYFSKANTRTDPQPLSGAQVSGPVYITVEGDVANVKSVAFWFDDALGEPLRTELKYPFDLGGGASDGNANALDTNKLSDGVHAAFAQIKFKDGSVQNVFARFDVGGSAPTPKPTPTTPPGPTPTNPPAPPGDFPNADTTGVPPGTKLTPSGRVEVTKAGTVIDGLDIKGALVIKADNVVVTRSRISAGDELYPVNVKSGSVTIEDSEITGGTTAAVCCTNFTLRRVEIHDVMEGPRMHDNTTIEDSWIHHLKRFPGGHIDALQSEGGDHIRIVGNRLEAYNPDAKDPMNAVFQFGTRVKKMTNCVFEGNYNTGGNYAINGGGAGTTDAACTFRDNVFEANYRYGVACNLGPNVVWGSGNVMSGTGKPAEPC